MVTYEDHISPLGNVVKYLNGTMTIGTTTATTSAIYSVSHAVNEYSKVCRTLPKRMTIIVFCFYYFNRAVGPFKFNYTEYYTECKFQDASSEFTVITRHYCLRYTLCSSLLTCNSATTYSKIIIFSFYAKCFTQE